MMPHNIAYFHPSDELYGADRSLLRLVKGLDHKIYAPIVFVPSDISYEGLLTKELGQSGIAYNKTNLGILRRKYQNLPGACIFAYNTLTSGVKLARFVRQKKIRIIHTNSTAVLVGGVVARLTGIPHIWHVREIITQPRWLNTFIANSLLGLSDKIVTVSGPVKENLLEAQPKLATKIKVVHNGIDGRRFQDVAENERAALRASWGVPSQAILIGMVGRISTWKGQEFLVQAALKVLKKQPNVFLVLVGTPVPGETDVLENLEKIIKEQGLEEQVYIDKFRLDIPVVLSAFDIFVLPSIRPDPFPTVVLEAMAAGKPVIATRHGGAIEQVKEGETGLLVSPHIPDEMTLVLERLCHDQNLRHQLGAAGRKRVLTYFQTDHYVNNIVSLYEELLSHQHNN